MQDNDAGGASPEAPALDDAEALRNAGLGSGPGPTHIDAAASAARGAEMARRLADVKGLAVVILGGGHDLTQALKMHAPRGSVLPIGQGIGASDRATIWHSPRMWRLTTSP